MKSNFFPHGRIVVNFLQRPLVICHGFKDVDSYFFFSFLKPSIVYPGH